eukprot:6790037-Prymnesium_polylepis.1
MYIERAGITEPNCAMFSYQPLVRAACKLTQRARRRERARAHDHETVYSGGSSGSSRGWRASRICDRYTYLHARRKICERASFPPFSISSSPPCRVGNALGAAGR